MDILISSNLERMLYYLSDGNCELVAQLMESLSDEGSYTLPADLLARIQEVFGCGWADEDQVANAIKECWDANGYVIDPHTACGFHVLAEQPAAPDAKARILLSTASPYKFPRAVAGALGLFCPPSDFACMDVLAKATDTTAPEQLSTLQDKPVLHTDVSISTICPRTWRTLPQRCRRYVYGFRRVSSGARTIPTRTKAT